MRRFRRAVDRVISGETHVTDTRSRLTGERKRSTGSIVNADLPIQTLSNYTNFGTNNEAVMPIAEWPSSYFPIEMWENNPDSRALYTLDTMINNGTIEMDYDSVDKETTFNFSVSNGMERNREFADLDENTRVIALANNKAAEHAILLFINQEGRVWSVGYGYSGSVSGGDETFNQNLKKITRQTGVREGVTETIAHNFETLPGSLYTSDYLLSKWNQESHIIWVGFLNRNIKSRILDFLQHVTNVELKSKGKYTIGGNNIEMTNNMILTIGKSYYQENAGWLSVGSKGRGKLNCIEWVKKILGVNLKCGLTGAPSACARINSMDWRELINHGYFGHQTSIMKGELELKKVVEKIQAKLLAYNVASVVGDTARFATNHPYVTGACIGTSCAAPAAMGYGGVTTSAIASKVGAKACLGMGAAAGTAACYGARKAIDKVMGKDNSVAPPVLNMTRGGKKRKTRRKNKRRKTRNKRKRRRRKSRNRRKSRGKRKTRR